MPISKQNKKILILFLVFFFFFKLAKKLFQTHLIHFYYNYNRVNYLISDMHQVKL